MKKFLYEYKAVKILKCRSETEASKEKERVTVSTHRSGSPEPPPPPPSRDDVGTIRTDEYKRDLAEFQARRASAEFQARRASAHQLPDTPEKRCGRHSLPISCTDCADPDTTFNYEKQSAVKYKKKTQKRARSANPDGSVPNIQFLFQNQVFMPGTLSYSEPNRRRHSRRAQTHRQETFTQKHIDFKEDEPQVQSPPFFYKNNSLPYDIKTFLDTKSDAEEVDGMRATEDINVSSHSSSASTESRSKDNLWEVMSELKNFDRWADEQLQVQSANQSKTDDSKSETSTYGLSLASASNLDVNVDKARVWSLGKWGVVPVQIKTLPVSVEHARKKRNTEINILRKCRHPNIILLMGLYPDVHNNVNIICERCVDTLHDILHDGQGRILSAQTSVQYALDIANALVFLRMQGYLHTALSSKSIMITRQDSAKLADLGPCMKLPKESKKDKIGYDMYSPEPQYVNIEETSHNNQESEPLISQHASETYMRGNAVAKAYKMYEGSETYHWHAPELFEPDEEGNVHPCNKSDVYSLCLILWESCNAKIPWNTLTYEKLKEQYTLWKAGMPLPQDGTYPGSLLALLQDGLRLERSERVDLEKLQNILQTVKNDIDKMDYIVIPARISKKKSNFSSVAWDSSPTDSECLSPVQRNIQLQADIHNKDSSTDSEKDYSKSESPVYESVEKRSFATSDVPQKCYISDGEERPILKYEHLPEKDYSSACSTPIAKIRARMKDIGTPNKLHRSDSTEYCSIYSPNNRTRNFTITDDSVKDQSGLERPAAKLSRSFTPKSYKPLHIKVPEYNLDCLKSLPKDKVSGRSSYNFDIKNYSLPTTPIARSNKLRKNAWLSGELSVCDKNVEVLRQAISKLSNNKANDTKDLSEVANNHSAENINVTPTNRSSENGSKEQSPEADTDSYMGLKRVDLPESPITPDTNRDHTNSWSYKTQNSEATIKGRYKIEEDILANVNVKPLVAIHEKWIFEANRKTGRSMSLPENNRNPIAALKPASHCVDTLQQSLPQLNSKRPGSRCFKSSSENVQWSQFCQARDNIAKKMNFTARDPDRHHSWRKDIDKSTTTTEEMRRSEPMIDRATDTHGIEDFIRELIRKELQHIFIEMQDDASTASAKTDEILDKGVANILEHLKTNEDDTKKDSFKSFSRVKINGNNKPLLQITFNRCGENSLQVLDNCVNVTICDSPQKDKNQSLEEAVDDVQVHSLKRCQAFNALQEARSTEDLYIDDELSTQMGDSFGRMRLIPLHGSLHEILCEKADDCCLIKVKQENGCDTIYFRCDHSDTESRDAIDGVQDIPQDTVVFKRSISLVEERIQRIFPGDRRSAASPVVARKQRRDAVNKARPKSEVLIQQAKDDKKCLSNSSPSLPVKDDAVELNIENVLAYQDSSDEECLKCQADDDFEYLERKIEEDLANSNMSNLSSLCGCLEKISEENLSAVNEDSTDKESSPDPGTDS
ncbi:uncharacterized protein LOC125234146 isoform X2 [Leguminivora glycinivorella]|uniref:uncharacterized protein LOC125234146 isoform X2 n=1 Tax=Leguminivora glycinivorella TaxID=1035111 RepID=UPI002010A3C6|nr:uncharacterized protein LOC125234146 isoform X2 [Leguminivora glycinivorella]